MNTMDIIKREANLSTDFKFEGAINACETIAEVEQILKLVLGRKGNVGEDVAPTHVTREHQSIRVIRLHTYTRV